MKKLMRLVPLSPVLGAAICAGCATLTVGSTQTVRIVSVPPGSSARVLPTGKTLTTPGEVTLARNKVYTVIVEMDGYKTAKAYINHNVGDAFSGNVILGGLLGMAIDINSGAAWTLSPDRVEVHLEPDVSPASD